jgi:serine protease inhibitor
LSTASGSDSARNAVQNLLTTTAFSTVRHIETENGKNLHNPYSVTMHAKIPISYSGVERTQQQQPTLENVEDKQPGFEQNS